METPNRKVGVGALAGAATAILIWIIGMKGVAVPPEVAVAITVILTFGVSYFIPEPLRRKR